jgi:hypothetical protein
VSRYPKGQQPAIQSFGRRDRPSSVKEAEQLIVGALGPGQLVGEDQGESGLASTWHPGDGQQWRLAFLWAQGPQGPGDLGPAAHEPRRAGRQLVRPVVGGFRPTGGQLVLGPQRLDHRPGCGQQRRRDAEQGHHGQGRVPDRRYSGQAAGKASEDG